MRDAILLDDFKTNSHDGISRLTPSCHPMWAAQSRIGKADEKGPTSNNLLILLSIRGTKSGFISIWLPCEAVLYR